MKPKEATTTKAIQKKEPHTKFRQVTQYDSMPVTLITESEATTTEIIDMRKNPNKYSFGQVVFKNGFIEAYIYPQKNLKSVIWSCNKTDMSNRVQYTIDKRRRNEIRSLITKIGYFLALSDERKQIYLRNHGYSANINTNGEKNA